jgi:hypothetical protein
MSIAFRNFLIDQEDCLYRLPNITAQNGRHKADALIESASR